MFQPPGKGNRPAFVCYGVTGAVIVQARKQVKTGSAAIRELIRVEMRRQATCDARAQKQ